MQHKTFFVPCFVQKFHFNASGHERNFLEKTSKTFLTTLVLKRDINMMALAKNKNTNTNYLLVGDDV